MIKQLAVGNDLVYLPDFETSLNERFIEKVYTAKEQAYCSLFDHASLRFASTWAAKEAVYKAVKQLDARPLPFNKIEIIREKVGGKPQVNLLTKHPLPLAVSLSLSHDGDYAWAVAIVTAI